jgi:hypothetical protein
VWSPRSTKRGASWPSGRIAEASAPAAIRSHPMRAADARRSESLPAPRRLLLPVQPATFVASGLGLAEGAVNGDLGQGACRSRPGPDRSCFEIGLQLCKSVAWALSSALQACKPRLPNQRWPALTSLEGAPAFNVGRAYAAFAADIENGTHTVPDFADAVRRHEVIAAIERSAASGERLRYGCSDPRGSTSWDWGLRWASRGGLHDGHITRDISRFVNALI